MTRRISSFLRRFKRREDGGLVIEFVLAVPLVFTIFMTSVEMGIYAMRGTFLERGVDMAVREVRLGTGLNFDHDTLKQKICDYSGFLEDCSTTLRLEMRPISVHNYQEMPAEADCIDVSEPGIL